MPVPSQLAVVDPELGEPELLSLVSATSPWAWVFGAAVLETIDAGDAMMVGETIGVVDEADGRKVVSVGWTHGLKSLWVSPAN